MEKQFLKSKYRVEYRLERDGPWMFLEKGFENTNEALKAREEVIKKFAFDAVVKSNEHGV